MVAATCSGDDWSAKIFDIKTCQEVYAFKDFAKTSFTIDVNEFTNTIAVGDFEGKFQVLGYDKSRL